MFGWLTFFKFNLTLAAGELSEFFSGLWVSLVFSSYIHLHNYREIVNCFVETEQKIAKVFSYFNLSEHWFTINFWSIACILIFFMQKIFLFLDYLLCLVGSLTDTVFFWFSSTWNAGNSSFNTLQDFPSCANNLPLNCGSAAADLALFSCKGIPFDSQSFLTPNPNP